MVSTCTTNSLATNGTASTGIPASTPTRSTRRHATKAPKPWIKPDMSAHQTFLHQLADARIVEFGAGTFSLHLAEIEQIEMIGERQRLLDILLDQQHRSTARRLRGAQDVVDLRHQVR